MAPPVLPALNFPPYDFVTRERDSKLYLLDPVRHCYVRATGEEWVRQHVVQFLIQEREVPRALLAIEKAFTYQDMRRRADAVVYDRQGRALLMVECKAPDVVLGQSVFDQVARYNRVLNAFYLLVTNGLTHYCYTPRGTDRTYHFLDDIPFYHDMKAHSN